MLRIQNLKIDLPEEEKKSVAFWRQAGDASEAML